ncbi:hypothetical protein D3P07_13170 [Paenibacillus sp. 1011MAR3C5]|uniref:hypothetical protein n=1 Tax=Paenibacillus sp. 1011MAR3C5 TaxID=1675787 RepID=UPI000E6C21E8|nr:hypothetical protein [Paenibacillus sp. 1011MAR3C5]RJE88904.1 hypothetical protein D3P07_13170 [Paenibacillus sp. 1011MAR3C5]
MYICFAEYKIKQENREFYLMEVEKLRMQEAELVHVYEGTDQPSLFVEVWDCKDEAHALRVKEERLSERSPWFALSSWIEGGPAKLHVWTFKPVASSMK